MDPTPNLVLSQTCGMPFRNSLFDKVTLIGTPDFGLRGCPSGYGRSGFVVRADDPRDSVADFADAVFAYNQDHSQSGYCSPYHHVAALGFWFTRRLRSGQHLASARAVADGTADVAAIDAVTWGLAEEPRSVHLQTSSHRLDQANTRAAVHLTSRCASQRHLCCSSGSHRRPF